MRVRSCVLAILFLALLDRPSAGFGYEELYADGTPLPGVSTSSLMMGGAWAVGYGEASSVLRNPANLGRVTMPGIELSAGPAIGREAVEDSTGRHVRSHLSWGPTSVSLRLPAGRSVTLGAGFGRISDVSYDGLHYIADDPFMPGYITAVEKLEASGGLWEAVAGGSYRATRWLTLGAALGSRFGGSRIEYTFDDRVGTDDSSSVQEWDESALCVRAGATVPFGLSSVSVAYSSESDHFPARVAAGAILHSGATGTGYSIAIEGEVSDPGDANTFTGRLSTKITPESALSLGAGLYFTDRGSSSARSMFGLCFGVGVKFGKVALLGSFSWNSTTRQANAFGYEGFDSVTDAVSLFGLGLDWVF